ncbi:transposase [Streptomyces uncialis]|uniref:transposase n=1 Tax=Streptomyces uncialis TaxID=1048205 RepID=UPI00386F5FD6
MTGGEWAVLEPLLPVGNNRCGRWRDHRQVINGIIHPLGTGVQWRELSPFQPDRGAVVLVGAGCTKRWSSW